MEGVEKQGGIELRKVAAGSELLRAVTELGDSSRRYVGFFPRDAFERNAEEGRIIAAVSDRNELLGYILYYTGRGRAVIQQLCVATTNRRRGVGRRLVEQLKKETKHLDGILVHCRRDFPAHEFWPQVGFVAVGEKLGRGKAVKSLTRYWYEHEQPMLFQRTLPLEKLTVVLDANIFFDLISENGGENEVRALQADWLNEHVEFAITDELFNEISRQRDPCVRKRDRARAKSFLLLTTKQDEVEGQCVEIRKVLDAENKMSDRSDVRQLGHAIAGGVRFFLTRDDGMLRRTDEVYDVFGITILGPVELILQIDELLREVDYRPKRLLGSPMKVRMLGAQDLSDVTNLFLRHEQGERKVDFKQKIRSGLAKTREARGWVIEEQGGALLSFALAKEPTANQTNVLLFRVKDCPLAGVLARDLAAYIVQRCRQHEGKAHIVRVCDPYVTPCVGEALRDVGFSQFNDRWVKVNSGKVNSREAFEIRLEEQASEPDVRELVRCMSRLCGERTSSLVAARIERLLWPGRLLGGGIESYIVPVRPQYALDLFDEGLATQSLFGARTQTALAWENVYFRASVPRVLEAPGRILWYVSRDKDYVGSGRITACSSLDRVVVGPAKRVYAKLRRFSVYEWQDVMRTTHGEPKGEMMGFIFSGTELLRTPVGLKAVREVLQKGMGTKPPLSTPVKIPEECFVDIYTMGCSESGK